MERKFGEFAQRSASAPFLLAVLLLISLPIVCSQSSYIIQPASKGSGTDTAELTYSTTWGMYNDKNVSAFYAWINNPIGHFTILYPELKNGSCGFYQLPSVAAKNKGCLYATNGGPFVMYQPPNKPSCLGYIVSEGDIIQNQETTNINFGLLTNGSFVMGELEPSDVESLGFESLVSGFGWLLELGEISPASGGEIAPRTVIGTDTNGRLLLFEADGIEDGDLGLTLQQAAQWVQLLGAYNAVNLDGGGSSVTYYNGSIVDSPHCHDTYFTCERPVTTVPCILP